MSKYRQKTKNYNLLVWLSLVLITFGLIGAISGQEVKDGIAEDQIIICVNGHVVDLAGNICHVYNLDDLDYYDEQTQKDFYSLNNSFDMAVID